MVLQARRKETKMKEKLHVIECGKAMDADAMYDILDEYGDDAMYDIVVYEPVTNAAVTA